MASKIVDSWWYTDSSGKVIGIVKTKDTLSGEIKFRIGNGYGLNKDEDIAMIINIGARFVPEMIK